MYIHYHKEERRCWATIMAHAKELPVFLKKYLFTCNVININRLVYYTVVWGLQAFISLLV